MKYIQQYLARFDVDAIATTVFNKLVSLLLLYLIFLITKKLGHIAVQKLVAPSLRLGKHTPARQKTILRLAENSLNYALYFLLIYFILTILGLPVSSLLAGAGIAGVAIGLGAQGFLSDLVNGFFILIERQFEVGEYVRLTNGSIVIEGTIISVGIRTTQVRDADGTLHFIPNRNILVVSNMSRGDMRAQIDLPLYPTADLEKVAQIIAAVNEKELPKFEEVIKGVTVLGPQTSPTGQFSYRVRLFVENGKQYMVYHHFYGLYQEALLKEGIELPAVFPFPVTNKK
ncbi:mechanosensitive ion channel family protein [Streptococcus cameli]